VSPETGPPPEAPLIVASGAVNNTSNKRRREEEHETRKRELEIQILEQKLANERAQTDALERSNAIQQRQQQHQEHDDDDEIEGEIPPEVRQIHPNFPSVKPSLLHEIFKDKFDPFNLYKLHRDAGLAVENDVNEEDFAISRGRLRFKKRTGTAKDLGTVKRWSNAFLHYVAIVAEFKRYDITAALLEFHARIVKLDDTYEWEPVVNLALQFHRQRALAGINDRDAWKLPANLIFEHLNHALKPPKHMASTKSAPDAVLKSRDQICNKWNGPAGCPLSHKCYRRHVCLLCKGPHTIGEHKPTNRQ
jgi:hypothetical protein